MVKFYLQSSFSNKFAYVPSKVKYIPRQIRKAAGELVERAHTYTQEKFLIKHRACLLCHPKTHLRHLKHIDPSL